MNLSLAEITSHRGRLRQEIMERECLLAAFDVVEKYAARGHAPASMQFGSLVTALLPARLALELDGLPASPPQPVPAALPPSPPTQHYMHPELRAMSSGQSHTTYIRWAIRRMIGDYTSRDLAALLAREGKPMTSAEISVVLTRLKKKREIAEIIPGTGRTPATFRKPAHAASAEAISAAPGAPVSE